MSALRQLIPDGLDRDIIKGRLLVEVRELLEQDAPALLELTRRYGTHLGRMVGCGQFGCVWEILDGEAITPYVLKVTDDITEGPSTQAIINTGLDKELDGIARFEGVWAFEADEQTPYAIVRENIRPWERVFYPGGVDRFLTENDPEVAEQWQHWWSLSDYTIHLMSAYSQRTLKWLGAKMARAGIEDEDTRVMREEREVAVQGLFRNPLTRNIGEAVVELGQHGIYPLDLHDANLGHRHISWPGGQQAPPPLWRGASVTLGREWREDAPAQFPLLMFDLGHFSYPKDDGPIWALLRENPPAPALRESIPTL